MSLWEKPYECPDCAACQTGNGIAHAETCPIGVSLNQTQEQDAQWFIDNPGAVEYRRPVAPCDRHNIMLMLPEDAEIKEFVGDVRIIQLTPGCRIRNYDDITIILGGVLDGYCAVWANGATHQAADVDRND